MACCGSTSDLYGLRRCGLGVVRSVPLDVGQG